MNSIITYVSGLCQELAPNLGHVPMEETEFVSNWSGFLLQAEMQKLSISSRTACGCVHNKYARAHKHTHILQLKDDTTEKNWSLCWVAMDKLVDISLVPLPLCSGVMTIPISGWLCSQVARNTGGRSFSGDNWVTAGDLLHCPAGKRDLALSIGPT